MKKVFLALIILSFFGILVSLSAFYIQYSQTKATFCDIGSWFNCDLVLSSKFAYIAGIPVSLFGAFGYALLAGLSLVILRAKSAELKTWAKKLLFAMTIPAFLFSGYLLSVEIFVLNAFCIFCLTSFGIISAMLMMTIIFRRNFYGPIAWLAPLHFSGRGPLA